MLVIAFRNGPTLVLPKAPSTLANLVYAAGGPLGLRFIPWNSVPPQTQLEVPLVKGRLHRCPPEELAARIRPPVTRITLGPRALMTGLLAKLQKILDVVKPLKSTLLPKATMLGMWPPMKWACRLARVPVEPPTPIPTAGPRPLKLVITDPNRLVVLDPNRKKLSAMAFVASDL